MLSLIPYGNYLQIEPNMTKKKKDSVDIVKQTKKVIKQRGERALTDRREGATTNPLGANQYMFDPRQKMCWDSFINPKSKTFGNAYRSAILASYSHRTAVGITSQDWFREKTRRLQLFGKAEKVLEEMIDMPVKTMTTENVGTREEPVYEEVVVTEPALVKIKQDTAKFIAERLGKDEGYSSRSELAGPLSVSLVVDEETRLLTKLALATYIKNGNNK